MHARAGGSGGRAYVLVHGIGASGRYLMPLARLLGEGGRVYVPDLPGFGRSAKPRRALALRELAIVLDQWMGTFSLDGAVMVGNSFGCQVIAELAVTHPHRVGAAVFLGPTIDRRHRNARSQIARLVATAVHERLSVAGPLFLDYLQAGVKRPLQTFRHALADPIEAKLPRVDVPVLVLRGEHDRIVPQRWAEEVAALLPHGELTVIPGGAHVLNYDSARAVAEVIQRGWNRAPDRG